MAAPDSDASESNTSERATEGNLTARAAAGLSWSSLSIAVLVVANVAYAATVSRLLDPAAFGVMAMANLVVLFAQYFVRMGLASALVQKPDLSDDEIRAASTAGILVGLICTAVVLVLAPAVSELFHAPEVASVLHGLALSFAFMGWSMTGIGLLRRQLRFRALSMISIGAYVGGYLVVGVGLALLGVGVLSLVAATVTSTVIQAVWQYAILRHPMRPVLRWQPYRTVCGYGTRLSVAHILDYLGGNVDTFTIARMASTAAVLGQYSRANSLMFQPVANYLSAGLTNVVFATLSKIQDDLSRLRRGYLSVASLGALLLFPLCTSMAVAAPQLVAVVLGPQWGAVSGLAPWFALAGACHVATQLSQSLVEVRAELNRSVVLQVLYVVALAALILLALPFRSDGVWVIAAAVAAAETLRYLSYLGLARRVLELHAGELWQAHVPAAFASGGVALAIAATSRVLSDAPSPLVLAAQISAGALALAVSIRLCPVGSIRADLRLRLTSSALFGLPDSLRWRVLLLILGRSDRAVAEANP